MEMLKEWVTNIILFVLFATVLDMVLPNSKFQKYTKMVVGLLLISIILTPIFKLFTYDLEEALSEVPTFGETKENEIKSLIDLQKNEIQASQDAYIFKQMTVQLKEEAEEELMGRHGLVITDLKLLTDENDKRPFPENLQKVVIKLAAKPHVQEAVEAVKPVAIDTNEPLLTQKETAQKQEVTQLLSEKWSMDEDTLEVYIDGGARGRMKEDKGPFSWLKKQAAKEEHGEKKKGKYPYLLLLLMFGAGIMLLSNLFVRNEAVPADIAVFKQQEQQEDEAAEVFANKKSSGNGEIEAYEQAYENQLKEALDAIVGVSDVTVVVNVDATEKQVLEKNSKSQNQVTEETDREGGKRKVEDHSTDDQLVIIQNGEKEVPIVIEKKKPAIRGVLIVAKGADNIQVKKWILEAVTRVLDVPSHRVSVLPKKTKGDS